ncbi:MAG: efflux RND transporter periplasmic adaptor subunit, partial [Bacteroidota bacterium]
IKLKKKTRNIILISVGVLILFSFIAKKAGWIGKEVGFEVNTQRVELKTITESVSASGKIQPEVEVKISPDVSGEIVDLYVKEGQEVKKGEVLCKINPLLYISNKERTQASVNTSKANLANAKARLLQSKAVFVNTELTYNRNKKLFDQGAISEAEFENSKSQYESAKADVEAAVQTVSASDFNIKNAVASLEEASNNLDRTIIRSPVDGKVSKLNVEKGERVVGTSQMAGTELLRIANLNEMEVVVDVNENDIVKIHLNDTTLIEVDAYLGQKFKGIVTSIANSANTNGTSADQITNFEVKIRILRDSYSHLLNNKQDNNSPFRPGMTATVDIQTKTIKNVLAVPIEAVTLRTDTTSENKIRKKNKKDAGEEEKDKNNKEEAIELVFIFENGKAVIKPVKTGIQDNNFIQLLSGISKGDEVIVGPYKTVSKLLKNRSLVKVVQEEELNKEKD